MILLYETNSVVKGYFVIIITISVKKISMVKTVHAVQGFTIICRMLDVRQSLSRKKNQLAPICANNLMQK